MSLLTDTSEILLAQLSRHIQNLSLLPLPLLPLWLESLGTIATLTQASLLLSSLYSMHLQLIPSRAIKEILSKYKLDHVPPLFKTLPRFPISLWIKVKVQTIEYMLFPQFRTHSSPCWKHLILSNILYHSLIYCIYCLCLGSHKNVGSMKAGIFLCYVHWFFCFVSHSRT